MDQQIELLGDDYVKRFFGTCVNGKLTLDGSEEMLYEDVWFKDGVEGVSWEIQVGLHTDAQVVFGRGEDESTLTVLPEFPLVDQVISASFSWKDHGKTAAEGDRAEVQLGSLARAALRAAYIGAYLAAIERGRHLLILTLIGGGEHKNPTNMIFKELA